ncbi:MAG: hypothetical protein ACRC30_16685 [Clostridium sp.]
MNKKEEAIKLDEILKFSTSMSNRVLLAFLNSLFNENFTEEEVEITVSNNEFITEKLEKLRADVFFRVEDIRSFSKTNFHIEFQTLNDKTMIFRMLEYGFEKAALERTLDTIIFPKQYVIFIEENEKIPDSLKLQIKFQDNQSIHYEVPVMKYWKYDDKDLLEKKMYSLLPLQIFLFRKELSKNFKNGKLKDKEKFIKKIKELTETLVKEATGLFKIGEIVGEDYDKILVMIDYLISYLNNKYIYDNEIEEEIRVLNRTYLDTEAIRIGREQGLQKGLEQGLEKGLEQGLEKGLEQGLEKGLEQGLEKGLEKGDLKRATIGIKNMLRNGMDKKLISEMLEVSLDLVERVSKEKNVWN